MGAHLRDDLKADSLDLVELIMDIEERFGVKITDEEAQSITHGRRGRRLHLRARLHRLTSPASSTRCRTSSGGAFSATPRGMPTRGARTSGSSSSATPSSGAIVAEELLRRHPAADEGRLARLKAHIVSRRSCTAVGAPARRSASRMLAQGVERGRERRRAARRRRRRVLAALVEAAIGAIYLERGWEAVREAVVTPFADRFGWPRTSASTPRRSSRRPCNVRARSVQYEVVERHRPGRTPQHFESVARRRRHRDRPRRRHARRRTPSRRRRGLALAALDAGRRR